VGGHAVTYAGNHAVTFRMDDEGRLTAFCGMGSDRITIDGKTTVYADSPIPTAAWAPVESQRRIEGGALMEMFFQGDGAVHIPVYGLPEAVQVVAQGPTLGSRGQAVPSQREGDTLTITLDQTSSNRWLFVLPGG